MKPIEIRLPRVFGNHMVLQRDKPLPIWGWGTPKDIVTVEIMNIWVQTQVSEGGRWKVFLPPLPAGGPHMMVIQGANKVTFEDVMVGEVWLCSGQSNMEMGVGVCESATHEINSADYPNIRLLTVTRTWNVLPQDDLLCAWKRCSSRTISEGNWGGFSAVGYFFGRELHNNLGVPIGLINSSYSGSRIEPWTPPEGFLGFPDLGAANELMELADPKSQYYKTRIENLLRRIEEWLGTAKNAFKNDLFIPALQTFAPNLQDEYQFQSPMVLYNAMIHPFCPFQIRGAIWYQGESNFDEGERYTQRMKALITGWRKAFNHSQLPFYYVQIAPFDYTTLTQDNANSHLGSTGEFWEAQTAVQDVPRTGMVVVNDLGDMKNIHPRKKQEVGRRLAKLALCETYDFQNLVCSGPKFKTMSTDGNKLIIHFDQVGSGLASRDGKSLTWFEIVDADEGEFFAADARISGETVVLSSTRVKRPVAMRFAWSLLAEPNLINVEGLPAGAFRAGELPRRLLKKVR